jgi:phosphoribosylformylglycinamidine synthase
MPVAHHDGNYVADPETLRELEEEGQIVFQYSDAAGRVTPESNPNGSMKNIAGIVNRSRNVLGMMPHPDRCADPLLGNTVGRKVFAGLLEQVVS